MAKLKDTTINGALTLDNGSVDKIEDLQIEINNLKNRIGNIKTYKPILLAGTKGREVGHTPEYQAGNYVKIGNIVFYWISVKTKVTESGEFARVSLPPEFPAMKDVANASVIVGECINITDLLTETVYGYVDWSRSEIILYYGTGADAYWHPTNTGWLKLSGFYLSQ